MPDLITHAAVAHLAARLSLTKLIPHTRNTHLLFLTGTLMPDLMTRPFYIIYPPAFHWIIFFHTPLAMTVLMAMLAQLFKNGMRYMAFLALTGGALFHFLLDALQKQVIGNNFWLYPFSWHNFSLNWLWAEDIMKFIPAWLGMVFCFELWHWLKKKAPDRRFR